MKKLSLLIVDDYPDNRLLLVNIANILKHDYKVVENGKEAIEAVKINKFDVVMMDIEMPVMNGIEATKYIRNEIDGPECNVPIIAITAHNPDDFEDKLRIAGFTTFISKPYTLDKIRGVLKLVCPDDEY